MAKNPESIDLNGYDLSRIWFDFSFENQGIVSTSDTALYFWIIEKFNRCGWVKNLSITSTENMAACGFKTYPPYKKSLDNLVDWGFILIVKQSKNQYQATIIALLKNNKALDKALDKALLKQSTKQVLSNQESIFDINKTTNNELLTIKPQTIQGFDFSEFSFFTPLVQRWIEYKKARKEKFASQDSLNTFVKKLVRISSGNFETAEKIIEESMANNWAGIFELKPDQNQPKTIQQDFANSKIGKAMQASQEADFIIDEMIRLKNQKQNESTNSN